MLAFGIWRHFANSILRGDLGLQMNQMEVKQKEKIQMTDINWSEIGQMKIRSLLCDEGKFVINESDQIYCFFFWVKKKVQNFQSKRSMLVAVGGIL